MKKNKIVVLTVMIANIITSLSINAKIIGNCHIGFGGVNAFSYSLYNIVVSLEQELIKPADQTMNISGFKIDGGYKVNIDNILLGLDLSYIYTDINAGRSLKNDNISKGVLGLLYAKNINGSRINIDINGGYLLENKVTLIVGGIISYNPRGADYLILGFDKKATNNFGFGLKFETDIKLTEHISLNTSYRMVWFGMTEEFKESNSKSLSLKDAQKELSNLDVIDRILTFGFRFNF